MSLYMVNSQGVPRQVLGTFHWFWCLVFGPMYYIAKGMGGKAIISILTANGLFIVMPLMNHNLVKDFYVMQGWKPVG